MRFPAAAIGLVISVSFSHVAWAQVSSAPPALVKTCEGCHGPGGNGTTPLTPRLNGQSSSYIINRLGELTDLTRNSTHAVEAMYDNARMKDTLKSAIAEYFSRQIATPAHLQAGKLSEMGE